MFAYQAHVAQLCANTNIKPMHKNPPSSLNMIHHALFSFIIDVITQKESENEENEDM